MRCLAILLLLCAATGLATPASAHDCPTGMRQAWSADRAALAKVGDEAFRSHIAGFCNKMPIYVTEPSYFRASEWRRRVSFAASPCALVLLLLPPPPCAAAPHLQNAPGPRPPAPRGRCVPCGQCGHV
jgi:hypothetical protein